MLSLLLLLCFCFTGYLLCKIFKDIDRPSKVPFIDCLKIFHSKTDMWIKFMYVVDITKKSGGVICGSLGLHNIYAVSNPEDSLTVLRACPEKSYPYGFWKTWLGDGIFTGPATLFGLPDSYKYYDFNTYCDCADAYSRIFNARFQNIFYHNDAIFRYTKLKKEQDRILYTLNCTSTDLIQRRKRLRKEIKDSNGSVNEVYIDVLLEAVNEGVLTEAQMRDEINTAIFGGTDTTANTILYTLVLLGSHPKVQDKVHKELQEIIGKEQDINITREDLSKMLYLEACIKESIRLHPYGSVIGRRLDKDVKLKTCTLREGGTVLVLVWGVHRDASWGPDVEKYRPERWMEPGLPRPLIGFAEGPRACIGRQFAMTSMKMLVAHLIREFKVEADHTRLEFDFISLLKPRAGHLVTFQRRTE